MAAGNTRLLRPPSMKTSGEPASNQGQQRFFAQARSMRADANLRFRVAESLPFKRSLGKVPAHNPNLLCPSYDLIARKGQDLVQNKDKSGCRACIANNKLCITQNIAY
jgi:hypothetical protein